MNLLIGSFAVAFGWAVASILQKHLVQSVSPTSLLLLLLLFGTCFVVLFSIQFFKKDSIEIPAFSLRTYGLIALTSIIGFVGPYWILLHLIKYYPVSEVIALSYVTPLITLVFSRIFLKEYISDKGVLGVILIVSGAFLVNAT